MALPWVSLPVVLPGMTYLRAGYLPIKTIMLICSNVKGCQGSCLAKWWLMCLEPSGSQDWKLILLNTGHFFYFILFDFQSNPLGLALRLSPFYRWGNGDSAMFSNLPKVVHLLNGIVGICVLLATLCCVLFSAASFWELFCKAELG